MKILEKKEERKILEKFLSMSVKSSEAIFDVFKELPDAIYCQGEKPNERFVYIPGRREDRVLLVAHADTVWDKNWMPNISAVPQKIGYKLGMYYNKNNFSQSGIGADDRAGCAILYLLRNSGHSILIVDGEEHGQVGSNFLKKSQPDIYNEINNHSYVLQFDRRGDMDYKTYNIPVTENFKIFIEKNLDFQYAGKKSRTDIVVLCENICGANLSVGYYDEHTQVETLEYRQWLKTYKKVSKMLEKEQPCFQTINYIKSNDGFSK